MGRYLQCYTTYLWQVVVDNKVVLETRNKGEAHILLKHYLSMKKYDDIYLKKISSNRYTLVD